MKIEPRAFNSINITLETGVTFKLTDAGELGLRLVKADHQEIQGKFLGGKSLNPISNGRDFMIYLK